MEEKKDNGVDLEITGEFKEKIINWRISKEELQKTIGVAEKKEVVKLLEDIYDLPGTTKMVLLVTIISSMPINEQYAAMRSLENLEDLIKFHLMRAAQEMGLMSFNQKVAEA